MMPAMRRNATQIVKNDTPRPNFERPPVIEVALSVQFEPIPKLGVAEIGALWSRYRREYPETEDKVPISSVIENFGPPKRQTLEVRVVQDAPPMRSWFKNRAGTELIQIQRDCFVFNWRQQGSDEPYPRYEQVRAKFEMHFNTFTRFLKRRQIGRVVPNQCAVTYVNHIIPGEGWKRFGQFKQIFSVWSGRHSDRFLREPEEINFRVQYRILDANGEPIGRLHIEAEPRTHVQDGSRLLQLMLTARGKPIGNEPSGVLAFFDIGREHIVRGFASITTKNMNAIWGRLDVS